MKAFVVAAAAMMLPAVAVAVVPTPSGTVVGPTIVVNSSTGDQDDPHVSGDLATYTDKGGSNWTIRYFNFLTNADSMVPSSGDTDLLSDVSNTRIAFSRVMSDRTACMVFDVTTATLTEIAPASGSSRFGTALGGNTVAFVEDNSGNSDIFVADLPSGIPLNLSVSLDTDQNLGMAPSGNAIVWVRIAGATGADIMKAIRSGGVWGSASVVSATIDPEENPDTDGTTIVYDSVRAGERDVFMQPLSGGVETGLELAGAQGNPNISAGVIAFESTGVELNAKSDLFVYQIASNRMFQITSTPTIGEHLNDVSVLADGSVRVVWAADESETNQTQHDIFARTFPIAGDVTAPTVTITTPPDGATYTKDQLVFADYSCADEPGGSGLASCDGPVVDDDPIDTASVGTHSFAVTGTDNSDNSATVTNAYSVVYCFNGFFSPVDNLPVLNSVNAGRAIPVKFSLCGNQGLAIFAAGYPKSQQISCSSTAPVDGIEETLPAGSSSLTYDAAFIRYSYVWKSEKIWAGTCRQLVLKLADGTLHQANFTFR